MKQLSRKQQWSLLKWIVAIVAIGYLIYEITYQRDLRKILYSYQDGLTHRLWYVILVLFLMPINWLVESIKWKQLMQPYASISLRQAVKGVLMGVSVGLFTPNGIGEFGGRMLVLDKSKRQYAASTSIVSSLSQLAITITVGGACIVFFISDYLLPKYQLLAMVVSVLTVVIGFVAYFGLPKLFTFFFKRLKWFSRYQKFVEALEHVSRKDLLKAYGWSLLRYIIFCTQLVVLIYVVTGWSSIFSAQFAALIPVNYYVQTLIPTIALSEIGVRSFVLSTLFEAYLMPVDVIAASFLIWLVNLIIPGLVGLFVFLRINTSKL